MSFARRQRAQLLDLMREVGPFAETACEGWQAQDLAAHLWIRENRPSALPGIGLERFADRTARIQQQALHTMGFLTLLDELEKPSWFMRPLDPIVGAAEWYIHHEDVLRPRGEKVELTPDEQQLLRRYAMMLARKAQGGLGKRLRVKPTVGEARTFGKESGMITVEGAPNELLLHFSGRDGDVQISGDDVEGYKQSLKGL